MRDGRQVDLLVLQPLNPILVGAPEDRPGVRALRQAVVEVVRLPLPPLQGLPVEPDDLFTQLQVAGVRVRLPAPFRRPLLLLLRTEQFLDERQHGFLRNKSCTTNMVNFSDGLVVSINDCHSLGIDVVYFDFSKAFDSVNHDLILYKLRRNFAG